MTVDPVLRAAVWTRYERDRPGPGHDFAAWVARLSEESGVPEPTIRRVVAQGAGVLLNVINERIQTHAQQIADMIGVDLATALETLRQGFTATKKKVLLDKSGRPKLVDQSPDGPGFVPENMIYVEVPDWHARLSAVRTAVEIHGARAPQQFEINQKTVTLDLTPKDAIAELERLAEALPRLQAALARATTAGGSEAGTGPTGNREAIEGPAGDQ